MAHGLYPRIGPYAPKKQKTEPSRGGPRSGLTGLSRHRTSSRASQRNRHHSSTPLGGASGGGTGARPGGPVFAASRTGGFGLPFLARRQGSIRTAELGRTPIIIDANGEQLIRRRFL